MEIWSALGFGRGRQNLSWWCGVGGFLRSVPSLSSACWSKAPPMRLQQRHLSSKNKKKLGKRQGNFVKARDKRKKKKKKEVNFGSSGFF